MLLISHPIKIFFQLLFIIYFLLLTKNILFKNNSPRFYKNYFKREYKNYKVKYGWEKANTTPFSTLKLFYNSRRLNTEYKKNNLLGNFAGFIPLGLLLPLVLVWFRNGFKILITGFFVSLGFEAAQLLTGLGVFDIDDLILNTAGCFAGFILFIILRFILKRK